MYNLNMNLAAAASNAVNSLLNVDTGANTPRTPEILNSLIAMTNPLDNYQFGETPPDVKPSVGQTCMSSDSNSSSCSQLGSPTRARPSIEHARSQLVKAGLKLSIEQKRKHQSDGEELLDLDQCSKRIKKRECSESEEDKHHNNGLTPEDEERRRRRRERNKIAATKCRLKKRERTANLVRESETLETQNIELKTQLQNLEKQCIELNNLLKTHRSSCPKQFPEVTRDLLFNTRLPPVSVIDTNHSYSRPSSVDVNNYHPAAMDMYSRPSSVITDISSYNRISLQAAKPPSIIVDSPEYEPHLTNLDEPDYVTFNNQQCHNYGASPNYSQGLNNGCMA